MNSTKSKLRHDRFPEQKNHRTENKKIFYGLKDDTTIKPYPQKSTPYSRKDKSLLQHQQDLSNQSKQNEALFRNMQKCNQKMEYYKLVGSLQEQKRTILQQENEFLKNQNQELKREVQILNRQRKKLKKQLQRLTAEIQQYRFALNSKGESILIEIPRNSREKFKKQSPQSNNQESDEGCYNCIELSQKLEEQRVLYERDRKYLKQQIDELNETVQESKKQQKRVTRELQKNSFEQNKQMEIIQKFKCKQNQLKKQLTYCYKAYEQKCKIISELESKIDLFESQNQRILKLLAIFDEKGIHPNHPSKKQQYKFIPIKQRAMSSKEVKRKNYQYSSFYDDKEVDFNPDFQNLIDNRRGNRKCGSIKKIQFD